jgi:HK97 family phage prohead protease
MLYPLEPQENEPMESFIERYRAEYMDQIGSEEKLLALAYVNYGIPKISYKAAAAGIVKSSLALPQERTKGTLGGYASVFHYKDMVQDIILPGAFERTLQERVASGKCPLMIRHTSEGGDAFDVIGVMDASESHEDDVGLFASFKMFASEKAIAAIDYCKKALDLQSPSGLSVEFVPILAEKNVYGGMTFKEVKLIQVTLTPTPCNELACVTTVKTTVTNKASKMRARLCKALLVSK